MALRAVRILAAAEVDKKLADDPKASNFLMDAIRLAKPQVLPVFRPYQNKSRLPKNPVSWKPRPRRE